MSKNIFGLFIEDCLSPLLAKPRGEFRRCQKYLQRLVKGVKNKSMNLFHVPHISGLPIYGEIVDNFYNLWGKH